MSKRERAVHIVPELKLEIPVETAGIFEGMTFDDRDGIEIIVPQSIEPVPNTLEETLALREQEIERITAAHQVLAGEHVELVEAHLTTVAMVNNLQAQREALAQGTVWEVLWQGGRAWVIALSIEDALNKVRTQNPGVAPNSVKAAGVSLVI